MAANYLDWVMAHKKKGTYINKVGDKYYLYAAHSERIKGTNKVRRVSDGYIGRIMKEEGLIPANRKLKKEPQVFEIGLSFEHSYLYIAFPDISFPDRFTKAQLTGIERGIRILYRNLILLSETDSLPKW